MISPVAVPHLYRSFNWSNRRVWSLPLPAIVIPIEEIDWHLEATLWSTVPGKRLFDVAPLAVLENPDRYPWHFERILAADVRFPLDVAVNDGRDVILDGVHRLAKLRRDGASQLRIRRVPRELMAFIESDENQDD